MGFARWFATLAVAVAACALTPLWPERASAWDTGSATRIHDPGSVGESDTSILDTRPKWAESTETNASRVADCPSGYENTGVTCYREPYIYGAPSVAGDCPSGYVNTGVSCYREPYIYGAPSVAGDCPSGYVNTGVSCYREPYIYGAPSIVASCPSGYTNTGVSCFRGAHIYGAPSILASCTQGGTNFGTFCFPSGSFYCPSGYFVNSAIGRCYVSCPSGYTNTGEFCHRDASTISLSNATCPAGYFKGAIASRCNVSCPAGFTNTGEFCHRDASTISLSNATCPAGYFQGLIPGRCNVSCPSGFTNTGEFCHRDASTISLSNATCPSGYFQGLIPGRCNEICDAGFINTGEFCHRDADTLSTASMTCTPAEEKIEILGVPRCYESPVCPSGYDYFALLCYVTPEATGPGGSVERTAVSTVVHHVKRGGNTHLWIVRQALALLEASDDPAARAIAARMMQPVIREQWEQGLFDGDSAAYADSEGALAASEHQGTHYYNAAGLDRVGNATSVVTYAGASGNTLACTNARECAAAQLAAVAGHGLGELNQQSGKSVAWHLGLALHYMTDVTQPMHASGWHPGSIPVNGHPQWEAYVPYVQSLFPAAGLTWDARFTAPALSPDLVLREAALRSNGFAPPLAEALHVDGGAGLVTIEAFGAAGLYTGFNFYNDPGVDVQTRAILEDAYQSTASYLYAVSRDALEPCDVNADADPACDLADNCTLVANPGQTDADQDGYGNACDPDFDQNGVVNFSDLARFKPSFFSNDPQTDLNGDGIVNFLDLSILKAYFLKPPGPSGLSCAGQTGCTETAP